MEKYNNNQDIQVLCKRVDFPIGIEAGFKELAEKFGMDDRTFYGISTMDENYKVLYDAAVSTKDGDDELAKAYIPFTIPRGEYLSETITDWMQKTDSFKVVFGELMQSPEYDPNFPCVEWYIDDKKMMCWVKMK